jgi:hypothetical protein
MMVPEPRSAKRVATASVSLGNAMVLSRIKLSTTSAGEWWTHQGSNLGPAD